MDQPVVHSSLQLGQKLPAIKKRGRGKNRDFNCTKPAQNNLAHRPTQMSTDDPWPLPNRPDLLFQGRLFLSFTVAGMAVET